MATQNIDEAVVATNLFNVDGLVAFITGGGTGEYPSDLMKTLCFIQSSRFLLRNMASQLFALM